MLSHVYIHCALIKHFHVVSIDPIDYPDYPKLLDKQTKETDHDCSYFIVWSFEKMQLDKAPCKHLQLCFMIRVIQLDPEMGLQYSSSSNSNSCQSNEELPTYNTAILYPSSTFQPPPDYADIAQLDPAHVH
ncbi:hypothetical protein BCV72DRAFT_215990 [Rhizopus microsporus var. microsporus]|uniref:Uncharacterized protein n=1 Tax=Rhizopus microsporus var. microsporus TaxID=86635 RepID=A0A1X0QQT7_RHIZD|nr:hypothetical protein BCV72DRAFT_215990 [Rhizopus microsporus var. microsporus]